MNCRKIIIKAYKKEIARMLGEIEDKSLLELIYKYVRRICIDEGLEE